MSKSGDSRLGKKRGHYQTHVINKGWIKKGTKPWSFEKTRPLTITKPCEFCGNNFTVSRNPRWSNPFPKCCSKECRYKSASVTGTHHVFKVCIICKKKFGLPPSVMNDHLKQNSRIYCSMKCRRLAIINYPEEVKKWARLLVYAKIQQGTLQRLPCDKCGEIKVEAHHYKGYKKENWEDIQWLCDLHHHQEHERLRRTGESILL